MGTPGGQKIFRAKPPDKGSFPLDHDGECKAFMSQYMECLKTSGYDSHNCREKAKQYLECRMDRQLMTREELGKLGYKDLEATTDAITSPPPPPPQTPTQ